VFYEDHKDAITGEMWFVLGLSSRLARGDVSSAAAAIGSGIASNI
jgi:hypothetical protein